jgi:quercetin dioxygenase-like cupin family protein
MERSSKKFIVTKDMEWEELGGGVSRKFLGFDNQIMMVQVKFEKGAVGSPHHHFHTQTTYVAAGKFEFEIDGEKQIVEAGDGVYIEPNLVHGAECLEAGMLIDVFSPIREDFMDGSGVSYFGNKDK